MLRKSVIIGVAAVLLLSLVFGRSHVLTTVGLVKDSVKDSVPIEFELKRARQMIKDLHPDMNGGNRSDEDRLGHHSHGDRGRCHHDTGPAAHRVTDAQDQDVGEEADGRSHPHHP